MVITLLLQSILILLREEVFVCTTWKTYPLGLSALPFLINVYYVKWPVRIRKVILLLFITHQVSHVTNFYDFLFNLEELINQIKQLKPSFNARSSDWWPDDITSPESTHINSINSLISMYGFDQLITDPTHILPASFSWIDLLFTDQPNLVVDSGVHPSLHTNYHHQTTYCNLNLMIVYSPPYECLVWNYKRANESVINAALNNMDWQFFFPIKVLINRYLFLIEL